MQTFTEPGSPSLLRLIVELRGSNLPSNDVYLVAIGERDPHALALELAELEAAGLIAWSEGGEQWTPTMRGLLLAMSMPAFEPGDGTAEDSCAECA